MADWCALPEGVIAMIARSLQVFDDFIAFRSTCSSWLKATTLKDFYTSSSCPKLPLLILSRIGMEIEIDDVDDDERQLLRSLLSAGRRNLSDIKMKYPADERHFLSLSKWKTIKFSFLEAKGMEFIGSKGWFIVVESRTGNMFLFHPITRAQIPLPKAPPEVEIPVMPKEFVSAVLSASPSETSDYVVMVAYVEPPHISGSYIGFWKPGNGTWTRVEIPYSVEDLNYYNGKFYALTCGAEVWMCDVSGPNPNNKASKITELPWGCFRPNAQLVECEGRLLIVAPYRWDLDDFKSVHDLEMVELDVTKGSYNIITSLGSSAAYLGRNQGFSIDANRFPGIIQPNSIYFSDGKCRVAAPEPNNKSRPRARWGVWINI